MRRPSFLLTGLVVLLGARQAGGERPAFERVGVAGDTEAFAVYGALDDPRVLVYLPGKCGDPAAPFRAFPAAAKAHGTLVVVQGDIPCPGSTRRRWGPDIVKIAGRIDEAVAAVSRARQGTALAAHERTILGYSEGALRAEALASRFPSTYPAAVLLASPRKPAVVSFARTRRVAFVVGTRDRQDLMTDGAREAQAAGRGVKLFLLPDATHGTYGPLAEDVMTDVLRFACAEAVSLPPRSLDPSAPSP